MSPKAGGNAGPYHLIKAQLGRGLSLADAPEEMGEGQVRVLQNWRTLGVGRLSTRRATRQWADGTDPVLAIHAYSALPNVATLRVTFLETASAPITGQVELWTVDANGEASLVGQLAGWTDVTPDVKVHVAQLATVVFFCDEGREHGLTIWDPLDVLGHRNEMLEHEALFQPTFEFDDSASVITPEPLLCGFITTHLNHLCAFAFPDALEKWRFSYFGLEADIEGGQDAGAFPECESGSANIFAVEDIIPVLDRGERVLWASSAPNRLAVSSERETHVIYGTDRASWRKDKVDSQRGVVNSYAGGEADGAAYGLSHLGPWRYRGGGTLDDITRLADFGSIRPLLREIDCESVFFAHQYDEGHARWYYRRLEDILPGCDRFIGVDYRAGTWLQDVLPYRVTCAGHVRPSILAPPAAAPSNLQHILITSRSAVATWTPGDASPGVRTIVQLREGSDPYVEKAVLEAGASRYSLAGLKPATTYTTRVEEIRNGVSLGAITDSFATLAQGTVQLPAEIRLVDQAYQVGTTWYPGVAIAWSWRSEAFILELWKGDDEGGPFTKFAESTGTSYHDKAVVQGTIVWYTFRARNAAGDLTGFTPPIPKTITLNTTDPVPPGVGDEAGGEQPDETDVDTEE